MNRGIKLWSEERFVHSSSKSTENNFFSSGQHTEMYKHTKIDKAKGFLAPNEESYNF